MHCAMQIRKHQIFDIISQIHGNFIHIPTSILHKNVSPKTEIIYYYMSAMHTGSVHAGKIFNLFSANENYT